MLSAMEKQLNESQRDALVTGYMKFVGPSLKNVGDTPLTTEDLYEYLLLDPEVADEVKTSRVASAIASVQQYMTRIVNGSEPGFQMVEPSAINTWRDNDNQYAIWAAGTDVQNYAENYVSPTTRLEKSHYFKDLETTLNQTQLDPDRVQDAALAYLNQFEAVSNLYVLSGFINQDDLSQAVYYFIGRTTTMPYRYYWRSMDLRKNRADYKGKPVTPNCWSDWQPIDLPLAGDTVLEHTVRPVYYNDRLYVAWVERDPTSQKDDNGKDTQKHAYRVNFGYKRFDDTWTAPNSTTLMTQQAGESGETERGALTIDERATPNIREVNLLATVDFSIKSHGNESDNSYGTLTLAVFVRNFALENNNPSIYGYHYCDSAFNCCNLPRKNKNNLFASFRDKDGTNTLQRPTRLEEFEITKVEPYKDGEKAPDGKDIHGSDKDDVSYQNKWWERIYNLTQTTEDGHAGVCILQDYRTLCIDMRLDEDFMNDFEFSKEETNSGGDSGFGFCRPNGDWGATIRYHDDRYYTFENTEIRYKPESFGGGRIQAGDYLLNSKESHSNFDAPNVFDSSRASVVIEERCNILIGLHGRRGDVSGFPLNNDKEQVDGYGNQKKLAAFFNTWPGESYRSYSISPITNFHKTSDVCTFHTRVEVFTPSGRDLTIYESGSTHEMTANSREARYSTTHTLGAADFSEDKSYFSIALKVMWTRFDRRTGSISARGGVWKWFKVYIEKKRKVAATIFPQLKSRYDSKRGLVQYLDFCDDALPARARLNTTFVRTLIEKANRGLDSLLDYTLQADQTLEADLDTDSRSEAMDFNGANGLYYWEVFFHLPFLVASRFASEQQFDQAQKWLHYIFDPAMSNKSNAPAYWNVRPLVEPVSQVSHMLADPLDPDTQAYAHPEVYQKAVFIAYVSNLVAQGDQWYRQLTRDGLTQARVFYNLAAELLGPRPDVSLSSGWTPQTVDTLAGASNVALRGFEREILDTSSGKSLPALPARDVGHLRLADNANFIAPLNTLLLAHWDTLDARLYYLRHNLTLDGKPLALSLYAAPADPVARLTQRAQSGTLVGSVSGAQLVVPPYRFNAILPRAYSAVGTLSRFGETLLSLLERGDRASQEELQQQQFLDMSSYAITLQQQAIDGLAADRRSLEASRAVAQNRYDRYYALYQQNISSTEQAAMDTRAASQALLGGAQSVLIASGALKLLPNVFGFAIGGSRYEGATEAIANGMLAAGQATAIVADRLTESESYRRRREEWQIQYEQAQAEVDALNKQLDALTVREKAAQTELARAKSQQAQIQAMLNFMKKRFTQATLYQWLSGQLAALYYQAYDAVVSLCLSAQACWQYEFGEFGTTFIQTGAWNDHYRGLHAGETLQLNLQQMEAAFLARHERRLEITHTVSLRDLLEQSDFDQKRAAGSFDFELSEKLFDQRYPGHYLRQIKSVSISLPTLLGPYQDVAATLTQTKSSTLLKADITGVNYLNGAKDQASAANVVTNLRASQQIALSSGLNDAGQFELNFGDERYLPFEGTGAVSSWTLAFPRHDKSDTQKALLEALNDVIVHVRYTAVDGGQSFASDVEKALST
ncbi:hypothetical protein HT746_00420 [Burkholderia pyrrocinia]|uniref:Tc toxin subunit A-related protein n=1 Tax=Burkholderia pyrrocinia TaxID=60550 RepID=UPI001576610B|nr:neuraminidase-like domain-containing protein [Burkholderia pyrrocinia]NTX25629.1 hypothetical protein [Burkholderia pyrrocinia]